MSLANIEGKLTRKEMKNIMAGSGTSCLGATDFTCCTCLKQYYSWYCSLVYGC